MLRSVSPSNQLDLRPAQESEFEEIGDIWLAASLRAHEFLPSKFWWERQDALQRLYQNKAEVWVASAKQQVCGFMALVGSRLVALFVAPEWQSKGVGTQLLIHAKSLRHHLELHMFLDNNDAFEFYLRHQFKVLWQKPERYTGYQLVCMAYDSGRLAG